MSPGGDRAVADRGVADRGVDGVVDVGIVGGGPVGVTAALLLAERGHSVRLYETNADILDLPRAVGMDDEIQRVFQNIGLSDRLADNVTPILGAEFVDVNGTRLVGRDTPIGRSYPQGHHPVVMYHQPELEAFLRAEATGAGAELLLGTTVDSVVQEDTGDRVLVNAGDETTACRWLVAADGASSPIRKAAGVKLVDHGFDQDWLVFDVELLRPVDGLPVTAQQICNPDRPATFVPGHRNRRRWEFQLQRDDDRDTITDPESVWRLIAPWLTPDDAVLHRAVIYRFHATVVDRMRIGRVLLAGDAAHQMPPFLGQGLCSGIRDAVNLAWKLDLELRGLVDQRLLDTYDTERRPHAVDMVAHAVDVGRLIDQLSGRVDSGVGLDAGYGGGRPFPFLEDGVLHTIGPDETRRRVGKPIPQPRIDRVLLDEHLGSGFTVLATDPAVVSDRVRIAWSTVGGSVVVLDQPEVAALVPPGGAVIIRPDRYVAAVAVDPDQLEAATTDLLAKLTATGS